MDAWERLYRDEEEALRFFLQEEFQGDAEMSFTDSEIWAYANTILGAPQDIIDDLIASECDIADEQAALQAAWDELQAVPSYIEREANQKEVYNDIQS